MAAGAQSRICLGTIAGVHGVKGLVRLKSFTAAPQDIASYGPLEDERGQRRFAITLTGTARGALIARIEGIADRSAAERLKGEKLYVARASLPPASAGEFYHADLIGLPAFLADGAALGRVVAVHDFGGGPSLEIERPGAANGRGGVMVPFTKAVVPVVDLAGRRIVVAPPEGLFDEPKRKGGR
jgi:16S rRNA processing protein RimM